MNKFDEFINKEKFIEDMDLFYPGIEDPSIRPLMTNEINQAAYDFKEVALSTNPTDKKYQEKMRHALVRFSDVNLDTEDRERVCHYFEELMDIVGLESSDGLLNDFV